MSINNIKIKYSQQHRKHWWSIYYNIGQFQSDCHWSHLINESFTMGVCVCLCIEINYTDWLIDWYGFIEGWLTDKRITMNQMLMLCVCLGQKTTTTTTTSNIEFYMRMTMRMIMMMMMIIIRLVQNLKQQLQS